MTTYEQYKNAALANLTAGEREDYEKAYETAGIVMELASIAYQARVDAGFTQAQLAERMGTSQSAVAAVENGARTPTVDFLERLARSCGARLTVRIDAA